MSVAAQECHREVSREHTQLHAPNKQQQSVVAEPAECPTRGRERKGKCSADCSRERTCHSPSPQQSSVFWTGISASLNPVTCVRVCVNSSPNLSEKLIDVHELVCHQVGRKRVARVCDEWGFFISCSVRATTKAPQASS